MTQYLSLYIYMYIYMYIYIYTYICRTNHTLPSYKHVAYLRVPVPWTFIIPAVASKKRSRVSGFTMVYPTWGRGWMTKASGVGERRKGRGELQRNCHHHVAALFVPTRMQQWYIDICATVETQFMWWGHGIASQGPLSLHTVPAPFSPTRQNCC